MFLFNLYISVICICFGFRTSNFVFLGSRHAESIYLRAYKALHLSRILYKSAHFLQNKPNFPYAKMNLNIYYTKLYKDETAFRQGKNKPNQSQFKACSACPLPNRLLPSFCAGSEFEWANQTQFKPKTNPISKRPKMNVNLYFIEDYENEPPSGPKKQTQSNPIQAQPNLHLSNIPFTIRASSIRT
jgi:hypothetical protein